MIKNRQFILIPFLLLSNIIYCNYGISEEIIEIKSGETYWWYKTMDLISKERTENNYLIFQAQDIENKNYVFRINKNLLNNLEDKTKAVKSVIALHIGSLGAYDMPGLEGRDIRKPRGYQYKISVLKKLSGLDFNNYQDWKEWYETSYDYLVWSDDLNRIVVKKAN